MQEMLPQEDLPTGSNTMKFVSSPIALVIATFIGTIIGAIISALILGITHIIDFNWIMLIIGCILFVIVGCFIWYSFRRGQRDRARAYAEWQQFKENWESFFRNERSRLDAWTTSYAADREKEYAERYEELKRECMKAIQDAEQRLDVSTKNALSIFKGSVDSYQIAVDLYGQQLIHAQKHMQALEERLRRELQPDTTDHSSEVEIPST